MKIFFATLLSFVFCSAHTQSISGIVVDDKGMPVSFVTVSDVKTHTGCYTDDEGKFTIVLQSVPQYEVILISHIGYQDIRMTVAQISALQTPIVLQDAHYHLPEIEVKPTDANSILMDALSHIRDNYPGDFSKNHVVYRDYSEINDTAMRDYFFDYNLYLPSYLAKDSHRIYTTNIRHDMYTLHGKKQGGGLGAPAKLVKQMYPENIFDPNELLKDGFAMVSTSAVIDSEEYDVISFKHKPLAIAKSLRVEGTAYINKKDKGIRFVNMHIYSVHPGRIMLLAKVDTMNYIEKIAFVKSDSKYVLDYITCSIYAKGKALGHVLKFVQSTSIYVIDRQQKLKPNEIEMKTEVDDILLQEAPKDIRDKVGRR